MINQNTKHLAVSAFEIIIIFLLLLYFLQFIDNI